MRVLSQWAPWFLAALVLVAAASAANGGALVTSKKTSLGTAITNSKGYTLYLFTADKGSTSNCYGQCASYWPPLLTTGKPVAAGGVNASLLGTTKRKGGTLQVTFKGHPLYTYAGDKKPGQTAGEGFEKKWWAVTTSGAPIEKT
jgi:predicted lipoprotein with Yx(FWY)xxD motif